VSLRWLRCHRRNESLRRHTIHSQIRPRVPRGACCPAPQLQLHYSLVARFASLATGALLALPFTDGANVRVPAPGNGEGGSPTFRLMPAPVAAIGACVWWLLNPCGMHRHPHHRTTRFIARCGSSRAGLQQCPAFESYAPDRKHWHMANRPIHASRWPAATNLLCRLRAGVCCAQHQCAPADLCRRRRADVAAGGGLALHGDHDTGEGSLFPIRCTIFVLTWKIRRSLRSYLEDPPQLVLP